MGGDRGAGVLVEIRNASMQGQNFLCSSRFVEPQLTSLTFPARALGLFHQVVAARRGDHFPMHYAVEHSKGSNGRPAAPQIVRVNDVCDVICDQQLFKEGLCRPPACPGEVAKADPTPH